MWAAQVLQLMAFGVVWVWVIVLHTRLTTLEKERLELRWHILEHPEEALVEHCQNQRPSSTTVSGLASVKPLCWLHLTWRDGSGSWHAPCESGEWSFPPRYYRLDIRCQPHWLKRLSVYGDVPMQLFR